MIVSSKETPGGMPPLIRCFAFIASLVAVLSGLYHIAAVYLLPLPGEMHPNMHLLLAFIILLIAKRCTQVPQIPGVDPDYS